MHKTVSGFTLIELMVVLAVMAIILAIAIPSYNDYIRRSRRTEAIAGMQNLALLQAKYRSERPGYGAWADIGNDPDTSQPEGIGKHYDWDMVVVAGPPATFLITATGTGDQAKDNASGVTCASLTLNNEGVKGPAGKEACWR